MEMLHSGIDLFLHLDHHLGQMIAHYGSFVYVLLFLIIFCETGLVVTPFLPGDSLLFVLGAFAAKGDINGIALWFLLLIAAVSGDAVNYLMGMLLKDRVIEQRKIPLIKHEHILKTHAFFEKYGNKTIILARFVPIVRTFAPFLAGVGAMRYPTFAFYNVLGGLLWVSVGLGAGYLFGNLPWVAKNFSLVVLAVVFISLIPIALEFLKHKKHR